MEGQSKQRHERIYFVVERTKLKLMSPSTTITALQLQSIMLPSYSRDGQIIYLCVMYASKSAECSVTLQSEESELSQVRF